MDDQNTRAPEFQRSAEELQAKLDSIGTAESMGLAREARDLAGTFKSWETKRPADHTRIAAIQQLFQLNRRVMDYLSQRSKQARR